MTPAPVPTDTLLERNLEVLARRDPELAARVRETAVAGNGTGHRSAEEHGLEVFPSREGPPTCRVGLPDGGSVLLHSRFDPLRESARLVDGLVGGLADPKGDYSIVVLGLGLGHHLLELLNRDLHLHHVFVVERSMPVLAAALSHMDLTEALEDPRVQVFGGDRLDRLAFVMSQFVQSGLLDDFGNLRHTPSIRLHPDYYENVHRAFLDAVDCIQLNVNTTVALGRMFQGNILANAPRFLESRGVACLKGACEGQPAFMVAAGPSLGRNIDLLHEARGKGVVIAVGTALKALLAKGIVPHAVTVIDPHEISSRYFEDADERLRDTVLVADPQAHPRAMELWPGPVLFCENSWPTIRWLRKFTEAKGELPEGNSVAHLSFALAQYMGCNPLVFVGQDLAYTQEGQLHADGCADLFGKRYGNLQSKGVTVAEANEGGLLPTHVTYNIFRRIFEARIHQDPARSYINATEGGARIAGAPPATLRQTLDGLPEAPDPGARLRERLQAAGEPDLAGFLAHVDRTRQDLVRVRALARRGLRDTGRVRRLAADAERLGGREGSPGAAPGAALLERATGITGTFNDLLDGIGNEEPFDMLLWRPTYAEILDLQRRHRISRRMEPGWERYLDECDQLEPYFAKAAEAAGWLQGLLDELAEELRAEVGA